jgi:hypothetical protein
MHNGVSIYRKGKLLHTFGNLSGLKEYGRKTKLKRVTSYAAFNLQDPGLLLVEWEDGAFTIVRFEEGWRIPDFVGRWRKARTEAEIRNFVCKDAQEMERQLWHEKQLPSS